MITHVRPSRCATLALMVPMAVACGSDPPTSVSPSITLSLSAGSIPVVQGDSSRVTAIITRGGGFDGAVSLAVTGAPSGVTAQPVTIDVGATVGTMWIAATGTAEPGAVPLTVDASGAGVTAQSQSLSVVVALAPGVPHLISIEADGHLVLTDFAADAVVRVDPITGDRTIISDSSTGSGPVFWGPQGIAVEADGNLVVVDPIRDALIRIDPVTGDRTIVSSASIGSGPPHRSPQSIAVEAGGDLVVTDERSVIRVDPVTGDRAIISGEDRGEGPGLFGFSVDIAVEANGYLLVTNESSVQRIHPVTGDRVILSSPGPTIASPGRHCGRGFWRSGRYG